MDPPPGPLHSEEERGLDGLFVSPEDQVSGLAGRTLGCARTTSGCRGSEGR
jgi:hypothetical protein